MQVNELIKILQEMPSDAEVAVEDGDNEHYDIENVREGGGNTVVFELWLK